MNSPEFSIIIPVYNREHLIRETLASVSAQTFKHFECIVVDDGSTDGTAEVVKNFAHQDSRFIYHFQKNAERSAARNKGIKLARAPWLCFLDSDDCYLPGYLEGLWESIHQEHQGKAFLVSDFYEWDGGKKRILQSPPEIREEVGLWFYRWPVSPTRVCVEKSFLGPHKFPEQFKVGEDSILWTTVVHDSAQVGLVRKPNILYRVHEGNTVNPHTDAALHQLKGIKWYFSRPESGQISPASRKEILSKVHWRIGNYYQFSGKKFKAAAHLLKSIFLCPRTPFTKAKIFQLAELMPGFRHIWRALRK